MSSNLEENMRATCEAFVMSFDGPWAPDATLAQRAQECKHTVLPTSLGVPKKTKDEWAASFKNVAPLIEDAKMTIVNYMAVPSERRAVCLSSLSANTRAGPYSNEYVWFFDFDETGEKIVNIEEFMDSSAVKDLRSRLAEVANHA